MKQLGIQTISDPAISTQAPHSAHELLRTRAIKKLGTQAVKQAGPLPASLFGKVMNFHTSNFTEMFIGPLSTTFVSTVWRFFYLAEVNMRKTAISYKNHFPHFL